MQWFRLHADTLNNPKAQKLSGDMFKIWINILCVACENEGALPALDVTAFALRLPLHEALHALQTLVTADLLTVTKNQHGEFYAPKDWSEWQYKSNTSADRVRRHREKKKALHKNVTVTPPETDSDTEQKQKEDADDPRTHATPETVFARGQRIAEITGWKDDPRWMGNYSRLQVWLDTGHDFELDILPTVKRVMAKKTGPPPSSLAYFEKAIADAKAQRLKPMPKGNENAATSHHRASPADALASGFDRALAIHQVQERRGHERGMGSAEEGHGGAGDGCAGLLPGS